MKPALRQVIVVSALALALAGVLFWQSGGKQWDFDAYYFAAKADAAGYDPYDRDSLSQAAGRHVDFAFVYPPSALWMMRAFTPLDYPSAARLFLALKCLAAAGLVLLLARGFLRDATDGLFWLFCLLAFQGALCLDLNAGNVAVFEQLALWAGLYFFLRGRLLPFCALVLVAASFKLTPILFLGLLLFSADRRRMVWLALSAAAFAAFLCAQYAVKPDEFLGFLHNAAGIDERGVLCNPSSLALIQDATDALSRTFDVAPQPGAAWAIYVMVAAAILATTWRFWRRAKLNGEERTLVLISLFCVVTALVLPRFKSYSFILLLLPTYLLMKRVRGESRLAFGLLYAVAVLSDMTPGSLPPPLAPVSIYMLPFYIWRYYALVVAAIVWALYLRAVLRPTPRSAEGQGRTVK